MLFKHSTGLDTVAYSFPFNTFFLFFNLFFPSPPASRAVLGVKWKDLDEKKKKERDEAIEMVVEISVSLIEKWKSN